MLKTDASIDQIAGEVAEFLSEHIKIDKMILFGSYNSGSVREDSDFDIAIISEDFAKMTLWQKMELFARAAVNVDSRVELLGFSTREFANPEPSSFLAMIKQKGRHLLS